MVKTKHAALGIDRIMSSLGLKNLTALGKVVGVTQEAVSQARARNSLPNRWLLTLLSNFGLNPDWVCYGDPHPKYLRGSDVPPDNLKGCVN